MESTSDAGQELESDPNMMGLLLEHFSSLILRQSPPLGSLADRDQCRATRLLPPNPLLLCRSLIFFFASHVPLIARDATQAPSRRRIHRFARKNAHSRDARQPLARHRQHRRNGPGTLITANE